MKELNLKYVTHHTRKLSTERAIFSCFFVFLYFLSGLSFFKVYMQYITDYIGMTVLISFNHKTFRTIFSYRFRCYFSKRILSFPFHIMNSRVLALKLGCIFPMVIWPEFRIGYCKGDNHPEDAPTLLQSRCFFRNSAFLSETSFNLNG